MRKSQIAGVTLRPEYTRPKSCASRNSTAGGTVIISRLTDELSLRFARLVVRVHRGVGFFNRLFDFAHRVESRQPVRDDHRHGRAYAGQLLERERRVYIANSLVRAAFRQVEKQYEEFVPAPSKQKVVCAND